MPDYNFGLGDECDDPVTVYGDRACPERQSLADTEPKMTEYGWDGWLGLLRDCDPIGLGITLLFLVASAGAGILALLGLL